MSLLQRFLPEFQFAERHHIDVRAPAGAVLDAALAVDLADDKFIGAFVAVREWPARLVGARPKAAPRFGRNDFVLLGRDGDREIAYGLVGQFWRAAYGLVPVTSADAFAAYREPGLPKLVMNFSAEPHEGGTRLTTITRVHCPDDASRRRFTPYWLLIRPISGLIRRRMLARVKAVAEQQAAAPVRHTSSP
jgi:hypothetical protein